MTKEDASRCRDIDEAERFARSWYQIALQKGGRMEVEHRRPILRGLEPGPLDDALAFKEMSSRGDDATVEVREADSGIVWHVSLEVLKHAPFSFGRHILRQDHASGGRHAGLTQSTEQVEI